MFSQLKGIKRIEQDFFLSTESCPRVGTLGALGPKGCPGGSKKEISKHGHVAYQIEGDDE